MNRLGIYLLLGWFATGMSLAQSSAQAGGSAAQSGTVSIDQLGGKAQSGTSAAASASAQAPGANSTSEVQAGSVVYAELDKSLDAKKAKVGDPVVAKIQQAVLSKGKIVAPKGSKVMGHVTQVQAKSKDQAQSQLGIAFDRIVLKDGSQLPVALTIQAIGSGHTAADFSQDANSPAVAGPMSGNPGMPGHSNSGALGGVAGTAGDLSNAAARTAGGVADTAAGTAPVGTSTSAHVGANSHGVVGLPDLSLAADASTSTQGSVIASDKKNVKLDSGTELVLKAK